MREFKQAWIPDQQLVQRELNLYRGGYLQQMEHRVRTAFESHTILAFLWFGWRIVGLMLWGMALLKWNIMSGRRSPSYCSWEIERLTLPHQTCSSLPGSFTINLSFGERPVC